MDAFSAANFIEGRSNSDYLSARLQWQNDVFDKILKANPGYASKAKFASTIPLNMLPFQDQVEAMAGFRRLTGMDTVLNQMAAKNMGVAPSAELLGSIGSGHAQGVANIMAQLKQMGRTGNNPYYRFPVSYGPGGSYMDAEYAGFSVNFGTDSRARRSGHMTPASDTAASFFGVGENSISVVDQHMFDTHQGFKPGSKYMTFDIETAGLMRDQSREIAYHTGIVGAGGNLTGSGSPEQLLFRPRMFARGKMGVADPATGKVHARSLEEFMHTKYGLDVSGKDLGSPEFANKMEPFIKSMAESDYVIGHNIRGFDIGYVFEQLAGTQRYKTDEAFKMLVDTTHAGLPGKIVDTLQMARNAPNLRDLGIDPALLAKNENRAYSISNLLLQTNLAEKIGMSDLDKLVADKGLHFGAVDDLVTMRLAEHMHSLELRPLGGNPMEDRLKRNILQSSAIVPTETNALNHLQVSDNALKAMIGSVDNGLHIPNTPRYDELKRLVSQAGNDPKAAKEAFDLIRSGAVPGVGFKINPLQQDILDTRNLAYGMPSDVTKEIDPKSLIFRTNQYDALAYAGRERDYASPIMGTNAISDDEFSKLQKQLKNTNMPFAGLSREERGFGTSLSHITSGVSGSLADQSVKNIVSDTMVSNFELFNPSSVEYMTRSGRPSLPATLLHRSGILDNGSGYKGKTSLFGLSVVEPTASSKDSFVNLVYKFGDQSEANSFADYLERVANNPNAQGIAEHLGILSEFDPTHPDMLASASRFKTSVLENGLADQIRATGMETGVSVAQLTGDEATDTIRMLKEFNGANGRLRDSSMEAMNLAFMSMNTGPDGNGILRTAGAFHTKFMAQGDYRNISRGVAHTEAVHTAFREMDSHARMAANLVSEAAPDSVLLAGTKMGYEAFQKIQPHAGKILGVGALLAVGIGLEKRHKQNQLYDETMETQPMGMNQGSFGVADQLQARMDSGVNMSYQKYDPLRTANVVDNLNNNKIGHTNMTSDRSQLYGGVL